MKIFCQTKVDRKGAKFAIQNKKELQNFESQERKNFEEFFLDRRFFMLQKNRQIKKTCEQYVKECFR